MLIITDTPKYNDLELICKTALEWGKSIKLVSKKDTIIYIEYAHKHTKDKRNIDNSPFLGKKFIWNRRGGNVNKR